MSVRIEMVARRRLLDVPFGADRAVGLDEMLEAVRAAVDEMTPKPKPSPVVEPPPTQQPWAYPDAGEGERPVDLPDGEENDMLPPRIQAVEWRSWGDDNEKAVLQGAAEAAGVRVDKRWGMDRLRQEIAAVAQRNEAQERVGSH
jgi:hypothetical protein